MSVVGFLSGGSFRFYFSQGFISSFVLLLTFEFSTTITQPFSKRGSFLGERVLRESLGPTDLKQSRLGKSPCGRQCLHVGWSLKGGLPKMMWGRRWEAEVVFFAYWKDSVLTQIPLLKTRALIWRQPGPRGGVEGLEVRA